jgi:hypothetical protein
MNFFTTFASSSFVAGRRRRRLGVPGEPLQDDGVEVPPFERTRRQGGGAGVNLVSRGPLFPRVQGAAQGANRGRIGGLCGGRARGRFDRVSRRLRKRVEGENGEGRGRRLAEDDDQGDRKDQGVDSNLLDPSDLPVTLL